MNDSIVIAIDAMGSDKGIEPIIDAACLSKERHPDVNFVFYGDDKIINGFLEKNLKLKEVSKVINSSEIVSPEEKPSSALRKRKTTSMGMAIEAVSSGSASAVVSAGNTGALMAMSKIQLRTLVGISRPAMAATIPHKYGEFVMLDLGANIECSADNLVQFAVMGSEFAKVVLGRSNPRIGLLNVGTEHEKGKGYIQEAASVLKKSPLSKNFIGYIEGDSITKGLADVVVADGFSGNIALKTAEGVAKLCGEYIKLLFKNSFLAKIAYVLMRPSFVTLKEKLDPSNRNGAMFLGLNGVVVKSHGGADAQGFASAIDIAIDMVKGGAAKKIIANLATLDNNT